MSEILVCAGKLVNQRHISRVADALTRGEVIALPTETGFCFAGMSNQKTVHPTLLKLREAHPRNKPFSLLCSNARQVSEYAHVSTAAYRILNKVLPGPFTLILPANRNTPKLSTGEFRDTVGVRISAHPITQAVCEAAGCPLMVTSVTDGEELLAEGYADNDDSEMPERWWTTADGIATHSGAGVRLIISSDEPVPLSVSTILDLCSDGEVKIIRDGGWDWNF